MPRNAPGLGNTFTYADGLAAGLSPDELRSDGWSKPFRGLRSFQIPTTVVELAHAYSARVRPSRFFCHTTASLLHGMWLPLLLQERMEVHAGVLVGERQPRGAAVRGHLLVQRPGPVVQRRGLRLVRP